MMRRPKKYITKVKQELIKFLEMPHRSIDDFCIAVNKWRIEEGLMPAEGTPFVKEGKVYEYKREQILVCRQRVKL